MGAGGFALYYLKNVEISDKNQGLYGYSNKFDGAAVVVSTFIKQRVEGDHGIEFQPAIQGFFNDGKSNLNLMRKSAN